MSTAREASDFILAAVAKMLEVEDGAVKEAVKAITAAKRVFVYGVGRSGLVARAFAMRLTQLGLDTFFIGETITPIVKAGDLVVVVSNTGSTMSAIQVANIARRVGDPDMAEDLAAEVWERALTAIERYQIRGVPFAAWLYRIAGNLVANYHRKRRLWHLVPFAREYDVSTRAPSDDRAMVRQAILALSAEDQEVIGLCYFAGLTPPEIAAKIGNDIRRALAAPEVRERLEALNFDVIASSADELARTMRADTEKWGRLIRERGIKPGQ